MIRSCVLIAPVLLLACIGCDGGDGETTASRDRIGEHLVAQSNCIACHRASDAVRDRIGSIQAPLLNRVGERLAPAAMREFILQPHAVRGRNRMPNLLHGLPDVQRERYADDIVQYLQTLGGPFQAAPVQVMPGVAEHGRRIWDRIGCFACHEDMDIARLAGQTSLESMESFLLDPLASHPSGAMPSMGLDPSEAHALAAWLLRMQSDADSLEEKPGLLVEVHSIDREIAPGDLRSSDPVDVFVSPQVGIGPMVGADDFALKMLGSLLVPESGRWSFRLSSDDGSWLWIDGDPVVANAGVHSVQSRDGMIELDKGVHAIEVLYFELGGGEELELEWRGPGVDAYLPVPPGAFRSQQITYIPPQSGLAGDRAAISRGERAFVGLGCASCHVPGIPGMAAPFSQLRSGRGCLEPEVPRGVPDYGFDDAARASLDAVFDDVRRLESPLPAAAAVDHAMLGLNCYACHVRDGIGGPSAELNPLFTSNADLGDQGRLPPNLSGVGNKLHEDWIDAVFDGASVRPAMQVRMPLFGSAVDGLASLLHDADAVAGDDISPPFSIEDAEVGHRLVGADGFKCIECHSFAGYPSLGEPGVDLSSTVERIRPGWFRRYMLDPVEISPGTRMPSYFTSEQPIFPDVLEGDAQRQIDAIWSYLSLEASMPLPAGLEHAVDSYRLSPSDEPIVFAAFMEGVGPRAIAVGYPERAHVAWDAEHDRLALIWRGDFMDARGTWHQRAGVVDRPAGTDVIEPPPGPAVGVLSDPRQAWPLDSGMGLGMRLDSDGVPRFRTRQGGLVIEEHAVAKLRQGGSRIRRIFEVESDEFVPGVHLRAAVGSRIVEIEAGRYSIDDDLEIIVLAGDGLIRSLGSVQELLVPIRLRRSGPDSDSWIGSVEVEVAW